MASVQFRSGEEVIKAFEQIKCPAWALWDKTRFMFKGEGVQELQSFLDLMNENGASNAVYTLAYYETIEKDKKINSKTPFDGSFNFVLNGENMEVNQGQYKDYVRSAALVSKINGLEDKFSMLMDKLNGEEREPEQNNLGLVGEVLQHPAIAPILPGLIQSIIAKFMGPAAPVAQMEPRAQYPAPARVAGIGNVMEQDAAMETAVATLLQYDKRLTEHLQKLAALAQRDPATFNYIMGQLDQMKVE